MFYYPLNGTAEDLSGNGFNGFYSAIPEINRFGDEEKARHHFNGMDTYIDLPFNFELKPNFPFAIAF
ncbi:MAG: hypothetical protein R2784_10985 [Saprospiraceae bacterium]